MPSTCPYCDRYFPNSDKINSRHKAVCSGWKAENKPPSNPPCLCGHVSTSLTQMKRHRKICQVWTDRENPHQIMWERSLKTLRDNYGVEDAKGIQSIPMKNLSEFFRRGPEQPLLNQPNPVLICPARTVSIQCDLRQPVQVG